MARNPIKALPELPTRRSSSRSPLPDWVSNFQTNDEIATLRKLTKLKSEMGDLKQRIELQQQALLYLEELKQLVAGSGDDFRDAVAAALTALGLKVVDGPHPRADLLATNGKRLFAIETEGLDGCARESNVTQASRWAADVDSTLWLAADERESDLLGYAEQIAKLNIEIQDDPDQYCKGIAVIGTFRKIPLDQRTEQDFPEPVMRMLNRSKVCAMTGLELFSVCVRSRGHAELRSAFQEALFTTDGVFEMSNGWLSFLTSASAQGTPDY
jgi:hypothetical protein